MNIPDPLEHYKVIHERTVVWGDMDAMQHVNNTKYFYYCETARIEFLRTLLPDAASIDPNEIKHGMALAETACRFKVPLTYPDEIKIATAVTDIQSNEFSLKHAIYSSKLSLIAAEATARVVNYDFVSGKRLDIDPQMRATLEQYSL